MPILLLLLVYSPVFLSSSNVGTEVNIEEYFKGSQCILEPTEDFLSQYLLENQVQSEARSVDTKRNYRSEVNLLVQYHDIDFSYNVENEEGPTHKKTFNISLQLGDEVYYGTGNSKKEAKEMASRIAIENTSYKKPPINRKDKFEIDESSPPTVILNNIGLKHGYPIQYYMVEPKLSKRLINLNLLKEKSQFTNSTFWKVAANLDEPPKSPFDVEVDVDGKSFYGKAHNIQSAKHEAASKALKYLKQKGLDRNSVCTTKGFETECEAVKAKIKSPISILYEYAQKVRLNLEFNELEKSGPPHKPVFEMECILGSEKISAKGKSKKDAKRIVAEMMLEKIPELDLSVNLNEDQIESGTTKLKKRKKGYKSILGNSVVDVFGSIGSFFNSDNSVNEDGSDQLDSTDNKNSKKNRKQSKQEKNQSGSKWSPKEKLVEAGQALNLNIKFHTMPRAKSGFHSILSLDLNPTYICLGVGSNSDISQEYAALNALKFLYKLDVLEGVEESDLNLERFSFDTYIWLAKDHTKEH